MPSLQNTGIRLGLHLYTAVQSAAFEPAVAVVERSV